jgi:hypothetical protein
MGPNPPCQITPKLTPNVTPNITPNVTPNVTPNPIPSLTLNLTPNLILNLIPNWTRRHILNTPWTCCTLNLFLLCRSLFIGDYTISTPLLLLLFLLKC